MDERMHITLCANVISIVTSCDNKYAPYAGLMIYSLRDHCPGESCLNVWVLTDGLSTENVSKFKSLESNNLRIHIITIDPQRFASFKTDLHINHMAYYRLWVADVVDPDLEKIIYLDADMLVMSNIADLWNINIEGYVLGAVKDRLMPMSYNPGLGIPIEAGYFNSGVMLINLKKWREHKVREKACDVLIQRRQAIRWWDQDALNVVLWDGLWCALDERWNYVSSSEELEALKASPDLLDAYFQTQRIIHFYTQHKPWLYASQDPRKDYYRNYLNKTPWSGIKSPDRNWKTCIKKFFLERLPAPLVKWISVRRERQRLASKFCGESK